MMFFDNRGWDYANLLVCFDDAEKVGQLFDLPIVLSAPIPWAYDKYIVRASSMSGWTETKAMIRRLGRGGWSVTYTGGGHLRLQHMRTGEIVFCAATPSDRCAIKMTMSRVRRIERAELMRGVTEKTAT